MARHSSMAAPAAATVDQLGRRLGGGRVAGVHSPFAGLPSDVTGSSPGHLCDDAELGGRLSARTETAADLEAHQSSNPNKVRRR